MNWKSEAIEHLTRYPAMSHALTNIPKQIAMLESDAVSLPGVRPDRVGRSNQSGPRDDALIGNLVKRQELKRSLELAQLWVDATEDALSVLTSEEKLVLERMYIRPEKGGVGRLCGELGVEQSSVYRKRDHALYRFAMALYGAA